MLKYPEYEKNDIFKREFENKNGNGTSPMRNCS